MQPTSQEPSLGPPPYAPTPKPDRTWLKVLLAIGALALLGMGGCVAVIFYAGMVGPRTSVYTGNEVPRRFVEIMRELGALEEGEKVHYFYSDAFIDIRQGFYFVSDHKVVVYREAASQPLVAVPFEEIVDLRLFSEESFFVDSEITLELADGVPVSFPVSSEVGGDQRFFESIRDRVAEPGDEE